MCGGVYYRAEGRLGCVMCHRVKNVLCVVVCIIGRRVG